MRGALLALVRACALAACAVCLLWSTSARAATVAILSGAPGPALSEVAFRLRGELSALRFEVLLLSRPSAEDLGAADARAWLERTAEERGIDAALEVIGEPAARAVDVWIFQSSPRRSQVARVVVEPDTPDRAGALAIRAIEVLRSYDVEASLSERARPRDQTAPRATVTSKKEDKDAPAEVHPERARRFGVELGAGLLTSLGDVGPALLPVLRVGWRARPDWVLHATASSLGTRPTLSAPAGTVRLAQSYGALGVCYCLPPNRVLAPYLSLALGASLASLEGSAVAPARGHRIEHWSLMLDAGVGARFFLPGGYSLTLSGHVQLARERGTIRVLDDKVAAVGRPNLVANLLVGAWL